MWLDAQERWREGGASEEAMAGGERSHLPGSCRIEEEVWHDRQHRGHAVGLCDAGQDAQTEAKAGVDGDNRQGAEESGSSVLARAGSGLLERYGAVCEAQELDLWGLRLCSEADLQHELGVAAEDLPALLAAIHDPAQGVPPASISSSAVEDAPGAGTNPSKPEPRDAFAVLMSAGSKRPRAAAAATPGSNPLKRMMVAAAAVGRVRNAAAQKHGGGSPGGEQMQGGAGDGRGRGWGAREGPKSRPPPWKTVPGGVGAAGPLDGRMGVSGPIMKHFIRCMTPMNHCWRGTYHI